MDAENRGKESRASEVGRAEETSSSTESTTKKKRSEVLPFAGLGAFPADILNNPLLNEANKIIQFGVEKNLALADKDKIIQEANETMETLRKNIFQIQMDYEQLNRQYQNEMSYRAEIEKRLEITRSLIDSAAEFSNILSTSIKEVEMDKFKIAEFYDLIYQRQEEVEKKRKKIDEIINEQNDLIQKKAMQVASERDQALNKVGHLNQAIGDIEKKMQVKLAEKKLADDQIIKLKEELRNLRIALSDEEGRRIQTVSMLEDSRKKLRTLNKKRKRSLITLQSRHNIKLKALNSKMLYLLKKLEISQVDLSSCHNRSNDLGEKFNLIMSRCSSLIQKRNDHIKQENEMGSMLEICSKEKENLLHELKQCKEKMEQERFENQNLSEKCDYLLNECEKQKLEFAKIETELNVAFEENSRLRSRMEEAEREINRKNEVIDKLEEDIKSVDVEELNSVVANLKADVESYEASEQRLKRKVEDLEGKYVSESSTKQKMITQLESRLQEFESATNTLQEEKQLTEKKFYSNLAELTRLQNELQLKTEELQKAKCETESKTKALLECEMTFGNLKEALDERETKIKELASKIQMLEIEKTEKERSLADMLRKEKSINENLTFESEKTISELTSKLTEVESDRKKEREDLRRARIEISRLETELKQRVETEETVSALRANLESSESKLELYKTKVRQLESELSEKRRSDEVMSQLRDDNAQLKQNLQQHESSSTFLKKDGMGRESASEKEDGMGCAVGSTTPKSSRRLYSTPKRLLSDSFASPNFKSVMPIIKARDPYEYDSDDNDLEKRDLKKALDKKIAPRKRKN